MHEQIQYGVWTSRTRWAQSSFVNVNVQHVLGLLGNGDFIDEKIKLAVSERLEGSRKHVAKGLSLQMVAYLVKICKIGLPS